MQTMETIFLKDVSCFVGMWAPRERFDFFVFWV